MASYQLLTTHSNHQVQNCSSSSSSSLCTQKTQRPCSKAHNCLLKILRIISTVPPDNNNSTQKLNRFAIDLNIGFNNVPPEEESGSPVDGGFTAECGGGVDFGKCSEVDDGEDKSCKSDPSGVEKEIIEIMQLENNNNNGVYEEEIGEEQQGFMGLLIEAATLIFGDFKDQNPKIETTKTFKSDNTIEKLKISEHDHHHEHEHDHHQEHDVAATNKQQLKRRNEVIEEDKSSYPLVRSKRGRIQVLPNKYKDSILEPLTPFSRIRSTIVPNRRRSK